MKRRIFIAISSSAGLFAQDSAASPRRISSEELKDLLAKKPKMVIVDVREPRELEQFGSVEGYVNIPISRFDTASQEATLKQIPKDKGPVVVLCERGVRAKRAADVLEKNGYSDIVYGGLEDYRKKNLPHQVQVKSPAKP